MKPMEFAEAKLYGTPVYDTTLGVTIVQIFGIEVTGNYIGLTDTGEFVSGNAKDVILAKDKKVAVNEFKKRIKVMAEGEKRVIETIRQQTSNTIANATRGVSKREMESAKGLFTRENEDVLEEEKDGIHNNR